MLAEAHERLSGVWFECLPWDAFLDRYDAPGALFFLDPPYLGSEHYYGRGLFHASDFGRLADRLESLQGAFILTCGDVPEMHQVFGRFAIEQVDLTYSVAGGSVDERQAVGELIVTSPTIGSKRGTQTEAQLL